jgi:ribulose-bisphosphate carboxylase large chain
VETVLVRYRLAVAKAEVAQRAEALALEQTVELPRAAVRDPFVEREILGKIGDIEPDPAGGFRVEIRYPMAATALDPAQLLNVLFGNASLQEDVFLLDVEPPPSLLEALGGPSFGIEGIREAAGVHGRPLTCAALKPMGTSPEALGELCATFARSGIDVVKDDHGLAEHSFCPFEARVRACCRAIERVAEETGRRALYAPSLVGTPAALARQQAIAEELGAGAVLVAPLVVGLPAFWELTRRASRPVLAHPALSGSPRIAPGMLLGTIFRLYGADAVIFPHAGGRFSFTTEVCRDLGERMRRAWDPIRPTLPTPAGGMSVERTRELIAFYGIDTMLLVGGTLYEAGEGLEGRSRTFVERVHDAGTAEAARIEGAGSLEPGGRTGRVPS